MREAREEMLQSLNESNLEKMRKAAGGAKQTLKMKDGSIGVDSFTASAIMKIYDQINDRNKKTFENMMKNGKKTDIMKLQKFAMSAVRAVAPAEYSEEFEEEFELDEGTKQVLAHGGKGQYKAVKDGDITKIMHKGKVVGTADFDRGADSFFVSIKGEKGQKSFDDAQAMVNYFAKNKITEEVELEEDIMPLIFGGGIIAGLLPVLYLSAKEIAGPSIGKLVDKLKKNKNYKMSDSEKSDVKGFVSKVKKDKPSLLQKAMKKIKEEVDLDEAKYDLYHKDFSSAMQHSYKMAKKLYGITVDPKEIDDKVASGPKKPSEGKTNSYRLKGDKGAIQVQVYNKGGSKPFELNMYKEEVELDEKLDKEDEPIIKKVVKMLKKASGAHAGQAKDLEKAMTEEDEIDEGKMSQLHQLMKDGKSAKEIAKIMKLDVKTIQALMDEKSELEENLDGRTREYRQHRERLELMRLKRQEARHVDPADIDTSATDDDIKAADKNIMMQLRKSVSLRGQFPVEFLDKKKVKIPQKIAQAAIAKYNNLRKPMDKEKFQAKIAKSHRDLLMALKEGFASDAQRRAAFASGYKEKDKKKKESTLERMNKKLQEKKDG